MALTTREFLTQYSNGIAKNKRDAINDALGEHIETRDDKLLLGINLFLQIHKNYWKYGENGVLQKVPDGENSWEKMVDEMLRGVVYVLPLFDKDGKPDLTRTQTITAAEYEGQYYVQIMDAAQAKEACENRPVDAPKFIDRLVDFFCKLVGKRDTVCALWDAANKLSGDLKGIVDRDKKADLKKELLDKDYSREEKNLSEEEQAQRKEQAKQVAEAGKATFYNEELADWYLAIYANSHEMFPTYLSDAAEITMAQLDQEALQFAGDKFDFEGGYWRSQDLDPVTGYDLRINTITTLAFALAADTSLTTEAIFNFIAGEEVPGSDALKAKMDEAIAKLNNPKTRNSSEIEKLLQKGTAKMCNALEKRENLQDGISHQLGRVLRRNLLAFGPEGKSSDPSAKLEFSPLAKQIVKIQDDILRSYTPGVLQEFAKVSEDKKAHGAFLTSVAAPVFLPMNAVGQTNAAFLEQLSKKPEQERMQFIKGNLHVLEEMNENLSNYVRQRAQEEDCPWLESPESLKAALNGGMVRDYKKALTKSLKETGNMPEVGTTMDNLMRTNSIFVNRQNSQPEGPVVGGN